MKISLKMPDRLQARSFRAAACWILYTTLAACQITDRANEEDPDDLAYFPPVQTTPTVSSSQPVQGGDLASVQPVTYHNLWDRIRASLSLQSTYSHPRVNRETARYAGNQEYFDLISERAAPFLYWIVGEVERRAIPMEIALLPFVESAFSSNARSGEGAVGLWQFMPSTGRAFGLQQDWWYDARRDPRAATTAALEYLQTLNEEFDQDWLVALAAYNTGSGNVRRALRRGGFLIGEAEFWSLPLNSETRAHVPRLLALASVIAEPSAYGVELAEISNTEPLSYVDIGRQIELEQVASLADLEVACVRALNPGYLRWATHPKSPQQIAVPISRKELLERGLAELDPSRYITWEHYTIQPGNTLNGIAQKFGTSAETLRVINKLEGSTIIAGQPLFIPRGSTPLSSAELKNRRPLREHERQRIDPPEFYTVRRGDNLWTIARRFDLRSTAIAVHNDLNLDSILQPGQNLKLRFTKTTAPEVQSDETTLSIYRVRPDDTLSRIANRIGLDVEDLLRWNGLSNNDLIYPGQELTISP
ncbi:MAG TPA: lytic transglycosylase [Gammaproteobacteria bacterium]|nr:lytic transglycosylase [Gammaproteobacteria bacterium]